MKNIYKGTCIHNEIRKMLEQKPTRKYRKILMQIYKFLTNNKFKIVEVEKTYKNKELGLCGKIDAIFKHKKDYILIDWKTSYKFKNFNLPIDEVDSINITYDNSPIFQLNFYKLLLESNNINIKKMYICEIVGNKVQFTTCPEIDVKKRLEIFKYYNKK